jgi:hypothetical protein
MRRAMRKLKVVPVMNPIPSGVMEAESEAEVAGEAEAVVEEAAAELDVEVGGEVNGVDETSKAGLPP